MSSKAAGVRVGLVLGAGGAPGGAFHAGVLSALAEATGWDPRTAEVVVGTSAGSITGASVRAGMPAVDLLNRALGRPLTAEGRAVMGALSEQPIPPIARPTLRGMARGVAAPLALVRAATRPWAVRPGSLAAALLPAGTVATDVISTMVGAIAGERWPDGDLRICAVRLSNGRRVVFRADGPASLGQAVAASCAIPGYFEPVVIGESRYVDGGVHSPTNLDVLAGMGLDLVIVSSPMSTAGRALRLGFDAPLRRYSRVMLDAEAARVRLRGTPVIAFQPTAADQRVMGLNAMDGSRRGAVASQVRESTLERLGRADMQWRLEPLLA